MANIPTIRLAYYLISVFAWVALFLTATLAPLGAQSEPQSNLSASSPIVEQSRKLVDQGRSQLQDGKFSAAAETMSRVIRNEKSPAEWLAIAFFYRGIANRSRSKPEAAIADFVNALWLRTLPDPIIAQTHFHRALSYAAIRQFDEAMADFDIAQRLAPQEQSIKDARENVRSYMTGETTGSIAGVPLSPEDAVRNALGNGEALAPTTYANRPRAVVPSDPENQTVVSLPPVQQTHQQTVGTPQTLGRATTGYRIQLGALASRGQAQSAWVEASEKYRELLRGLEPSYETITRAGKAITRLRAGYIENALAARNLCKQLISRGQDCIVVSR